MPLELLMMLTVLPWIGVLGGAGYLVLRFIRAFERRGARQEELDALRSTVGELEAAFESIQQDLTRLNEGQEFTTRLLSERSDA